MRSVKTIFSVFFFFSLSLFAKNLDIDGAHSNISFKIKYLLTDVTGSFQSFKGTIEAEEKDPKKSGVDVTVEVKSINTGIEKRDEHLKGKDFFEVEKFPMATFKSKKIEVKDDKNGRIVGTFTLHGVSKEIVLEATYLGNADDPWVKGKKRAFFTGKTTINRKDYGLTYNKVLDKGGLLIGDEVEISINLQATEK